MSVFEGTADDMWPEDEFEIDPEFAAEEDYPEQEFPAAVEEGMVEEILEDLRTDSGLATRRSPGLDGWS